MFQIYSFRLSILFGYLMHTIKRLASWSVVLLNWAEVGLQLQDFRVPHAQVLPQLLVLTGNIFEHLLKLPKAGRHWVEIRRYHIELRHDVVNVFCLADQSQSKPEQAEARHWLNGRRRAENSLCQPASVRPDGRHLINTCVFLCSNIILLCSSLPDPSSLGVQN